MPDDRQPESRTGKTFSPNAPTTDRAVAVAEVTDLTWEKTVERADRPVVAMFHSPACAFCRQMEPYFTTYASEYRNAVTFIRVNVLQNPWTAERYGVRSTPTFRAFCNGKAVQELVGAVYPALLKRMIDEVIAHGKECAENSTAIDYDITGYG